MWNVRIYERAYDRNSKAVRLVTPIQNPDNAPRVIQIGKKFYSYGGYTMCGKCSHISYNLLKPRKGFIKNRQTI